MVNVTCKCGGKRVEGEMVGEDGRLTYEICTKCGVGETYFYPNLPLEYVTITVDLRD